jgi:hypothetical protein
MMNDMVLACADLSGRVGARDFEIGYVHDDVPIEEAGWYVQVSYQGARIIVQDHRSPETAALAMAVRLLDGATCRCRKSVSLSDGSGCRWRLVGQRWEPGCDAPSVKVKGKAGDLAAMRRAMKGPQS